MEIEVVHASSLKAVCRPRLLTGSTTVLDVKREVHANCKRLHPNRVALKSEPRGKALKDEDTLGGLGLRSGDRLYLRDLGPQIGWTTVFLAEYAGPLVIYLLMYARPRVVYGESRGVSATAHLAAAAYTLHYTKRILETLFVHRFSHATMPLFNLFKNCSYYWLFTAYVAYHVNHPLYTSPAPGVVLAGLVGFLLCEAGNLSVHLALRRLRPPGTKERRVPHPTANPLTSLFNLVSCPNYTYEFGAWLSFTVMTHCLPAGLFALAGFYQMTVWALARHRNYIKEFPQYPRSRKAILPFLL